MAVAQITGGGDRLMVGVSVALAGAIGFIGLVIPHILRLCGLSDHRGVAPGLYAGRGKRLAGADIIARLALSAAELPIGVVTATLGAPVFIWLLLRSRGGDSAAPVGRDGAGSGLPAFDRVGLCRLPSLFRDFAGLEGGF